jgi:hypothetical protein
MDSPLRRDKIIYFPDFERDLTSHPNFPKGRYLFNQHYQAEVHEFPNGVWMVQFPYATPPIHKFKICIQIKKHKVVDLSCTCHKNKNCEHTICALYYIRDKFVDSDVESIQDSVDNDNDFEEEARYSGTNSFIDDREESEITVVEEEEQENDESQEFKFEEDTDEKERTLHKEFQCQVCLEDMEIPVLFPCFSHSVCYVCAVQLFEKAQGSFDGTKKLKCPVCGDKYVFKIKEVDELKGRVNKGLKRMICSYKQEKNFWEKQESALKEKINEYEERLGVKQEEEPMMQNQQIINNPQNPRIDHIEEEKELRSQKQEIMVRKPRMDSIEEEEKLYEPEIKHDDNTGNNHGIKIEEENKESDRSDKSVNLERMQDLSQEEDDCLVSKRRRLNPLML